MSFFSTIHGIKLVDTIIRELPKIAKELKRANDIKEKESLLYKDEFFGTLLELTLKTDSSKELINFLKIHNLTNDFYEYIKEKNEVAE